VIQKGNDIVFDVITKNEYFEWYDKNIADKKRHSLKGLQDAYILSLLGKKMGLKIAEVGGGNSRVLAVLKKHNDCWNIDKFEGVGLGPQKIKKQRGIHIIRAFIGEFDASIPDNYFDVAFSISVVEHVPVDSLGEFFKDCYRSLKPSGEMVRAIDLYVSDVPEVRNKKVDKYIIAVENAGFKWFKKPAINSKITFSSYFASNSDATMGIWNNVAPKLRKVREMAQSISLKLHAFK
jgi:2-polyprenyl-3-methyl-5-hydroxy-6-metoxy-1,4-benzoquinol methylase